MIRVAAAAALLAALLAETATAQSISRSVNACGGQVSSGGGYSVVGTIGQALVGRSDGIPTPVACSGWWCGEFGTIVAVPPQTLQIPRATRVTRVAPNPGAGPVRIGYDLSRAARVDIAIYAVTGARAHAMSEGWRPAGRYEARWDGRGSRGEELASGVYFVLLRVDGHAAGGKRIVLAR